MLRYQNFVVVVLLYGLVCTRLQHSKNIKSCIASRWKSNMDNETLLLLKWSLNSIIHRKYKTHGKDISSKVCGCYMARLTSSKNSNSASLTILLYRLFTLLSTDGDNNNASVIMELFYFAFTCDGNIEYTLVTSSLRLLLRWLKQGPFNYPKRRRKRVKDKQFQTKFGIIIKISRDRDSEQSYWIF